MTKNEKLKALEQRISLLEERIQQLENRQVYYPVYPQPYYVPYNPGWITWGTTTTPIMTTLTTNTITGSFNVVSSCD